MCAINGFNFTNRDLIEKMNLITRHRGPDNTGIFVDEKVSIGHNLLSIVETATNGKQPFCSKNKQYVLTYNGEIYNYLSLRKELENAGDKFFTNSDTEVIFNGLIRYGGEFIKKLNGMFAFAFYDKKNDSIILARDGLGMKPLYYFYDKEKFIFSSELRGIFQHNIPRKLDTNGTSVFFAMGYIPGERSLIQNIYKVPPGQYIVFNLKNKNFKAYLFFVRENLFSQNFNPKILREKIGESVINHTMGLRPFGLYLSGGLDSSIILHELSKKIPEKIITYTTRFDVKNEKFNEDANIAQKFAKQYNVNHNEIIITEKDFINSIEDTITTIEEPRYNYSASAYWLTAKRAKNDITVVLSGSGGDELFMGYSKYRYSHEISAMAKKIPFFISNFLFTLKDSFSNKSITPLLRLEKDIDRWIYLTKTGVDKNTLKESSMKITQPQLYKYLRNNGRIVLDAKNPDIDNNMASLDRLFWLADEEFIRTDKTTMHFGMEGRFPLVSKDLVEYAESIESKNKIYGNKSKFLMREAYKNILPRYILEKTKTGWSVPVGPWMNSKLFDVTRNVLQSSYYPEMSQLFDFNFINKKYLKEKREMTNEEVKKIWALFSFQIWAKLFDIKI